MSFAVGEPIPLDAIEAGIMAARQHLLARSAAVPEGAGPSAVAPVRAVQLGTFMLPQAVVGQPDATEESKGHAQMKHLTVCIFQSLQEREQQ